MSLLLKFADLPVHQHYHLNKSICLSLLSFVSDLLPARDLKIKWPNDIYFKDKKIAGLLIQNQLKSQSIQNTIIGIGLNVNQDSFPEELAHASSVFQISGSPLNLFETTIDLVNKFMMQLDINLLDPVQVENIYHKQLYALNKKRQFRISQEEDSFEGIIRGVSKDGKLQLEANGTMLQFSNGEVELIPLNES